MLKHCHLQRLSLFLSLLAYGCVYAQQKPVQRDTSFTVYSAYIKEKKKYPSITIAKAVLPKGVNAATNIPYVSYHERSLLLDVFYPAAVKNTRKKYPGVLLIHGGGWRSGDKSQCIPFAQQLAAAGYVAVAAEYRLSPEALYPAAMDDLNAALQWMRSHASSYQLDPDRIATLGFSAGGQLAALLGTANNEKETDKAIAVQAIVDIDGILAFKHPESAEGAVAAAWLGGTYEEKPEIWKQASALNHVSKSTPPTLFINSSLPRFHAGRDDMIKKMDSLHIYTEVQTLPETPHPFWLFHPWFDPAVQYTIGFLDKHLTTKKESTKLK